MKLLLTGGTGTLSTEIVRQLWGRKDLERIVVFSRGEQRQVEMSKVYREYDEAFPNVIRYDIGDIRSVNRLAQAMRGCDTVIHAAALKHVPVCEYNPQEALATNVIGSQNVVDACNMAGVKKCIVISTDKAVEPITLYGASKLMMERIAIAGNNLGKCRFSVVRYANVYGSNGSVIPIWRKQHAAGQPLTITDKRMTRMWITIEVAAEFVLSRLDIMQGGEIFVPQCRAESLIDTAQCCLRTDNPVHNTIEFKPVHNTIEFKETGIRPSEKLHEALISEGDARDCWQLPDGSYACYPPIHDWLKEYNYNGARMRDSFRMSSDKAAQPAIYFEDHN